MNATTEDDTDLSAYTPTTESVRRLFCCGADHPDAPGGFDRWLAAHDDAVRADQALLSAQAARNVASHPHPRPLTPSPV